MCPKQINLLVIKQSLTHLQVAVILLLLCMYENLKIYSLMITQKLGISENVIKKSITVNDSS